MNNNDDLYASMTLAELRTAITQLDQQLLQLLADRRSLSRAVAGNKLQQNKALRDWQREQELLAVLIQKAQTAGLDADYISRVYHTIIEDSLAVQRKFLQSQSLEPSAQTPENCVAVLGGRGSYSYLAANKYFIDQKNDYQGFATFAEVFSSVEQGNADFGVIPIENTTSGGITEVFDLLLNSSLSIVGEEKYPINHCLVAAQSTQLADIKQILAHPEANRQCSNNSQKLLSASVKLVSSTAEAVKQVAEDLSGTLAAIASEQAAHQFGLKILQSNIADLTENTTRFLVVATSAQPVSKLLAAKTSIALSTGQRPGSLAEILLIFKDAELPLTRLESRPIAGKPWEQMFYIDIQGNLADNKLTNALAQISQLCHFFKVLGCYPTDARTTFY